MAIKVETTQQQYDTVWIALNAATRKTSVTLPREAIFNIMRDYAAMFGELKLDHQTARAFPPGLASRADGALA